MVSSSVPKVYFFGRANRYVANESNSTQINKKESWINEKHLTRGKTPDSGHACPLGGRCFCISYPVGRGRGPARF